MIDHDLLVNAPSKDVANAAYQLVDRLQHYPAAIQSAAVAALFLTVCRIHAVNPQDVFTAVTNMMADTIHGEEPRFRALRLYAKHELSKS